MTEEEALQKAFHILQAPTLTVESGMQLMALEPYISGDKFGDLWEAFIVAAPIEVVMAVND
jgi:hypothetical protein